MSVCRLYSLRCLSLHNNLLTYLPREILSLVHLQELSLRGNPLVVRFIKDMTYDPPSLLELAGRTIKSRNLHYLPNDLPGNLVHYLDLASKCPNPKCTGKWRRGDRFKLHTYVLVFVSGSEEARPGRKRRLVLLNNLRRNSNKTYSL